jgi:glycosyltransferase involved in cell wall biosynthesis
MAMISAIVPLYNKERTIARAMRSIFAQRWQDFELIVVDDGSTDRGPEIAGEYRDPRLRVITQSNAGPGAARNRGVRESTSPYICFLDADDEWLPEFMNTSLANLQDNPDCAITAANHYRGKGKKLATTLPPCDIGIETGPWRLSPQAKPKEVWGSLLYLQSWVVMCKRQDLIDNGGFYERHCTYLEDHYLWLQFLLKYRIYRDATPLHWYHTEDSDLEGPRRVNPEPIWPFLSDPAAIRRNCPANYRSTLERFLSYAAMLEFNRMVSRADVLAARRLLKQFPRLNRFGLREWGWEYIRRRIMVSLPKKTSLREARPRKAS